jgi:hypothetical protein
MNDKYDQIEMFKGFSKENWAEIDSKEKLFDQLCEGLDAGIAGHESLQE